MAPATPTYTSLFIHPERLQKFTDEGRRGIDTPGECVGFVQMYTLYKGADGKDASIGGTATWERGPSLITRSASGRITHAEPLADGTPIGTFGEDGKYHNKGAVHAAVFRHYVKNGPNGKPVQWDAEKDNPDKITGAMVVDKVPAGTGLKAHPPQQHVMALDNGWTDNVAAYSVIKPQGMKYTPPNVPISHAPQMRAMDIKNPMLAETMAAIRNSKQFLPPGPDGMVSADTAVGVQGKFSLPVPAASAKGKQER